MLLPIRGLLAGLISPVEVGVELVVFGLCVRRISPRLRVITSSRISPPLIFTAGACPPGPCQVYRNLKLSTRALLLDKCDAKLLFKVLLCYIKPSCEQVYIKYYNTIFNPNRFGPSLHGFIFDTTPKDLLSIEVLFACSSLILSDVELYLFLTVSTYILLILLIST